MPDNGKDSITEIEDEAELDEEFGAEVEELEEAETPEQTFAAPVPNLMLTHVNAAGVNKTIGMYSEQEKAIDAAEAHTLKKGESVLITPVVYIRIGQ